MFKSKLRTKFLLSLALISALLTWATLLVVRQRVSDRVQQEIFADLRASMLTFQHLQQQRETTLERSAALLASLPSLRALMTSHDEGTIQDASADFWRTSGSEIFVLADRSGKVMAIHTSKPGFLPSDAQEQLHRSLQNGESRDWWLGGGQLFEIFLQPIYFGAPADNVPLGVLAVGYEINDAVADDISRLTASRVAFRYGKRLVVTTLSATQQADLAQQKQLFNVSDSGPKQVLLGQERFLLASVSLPPGNPPLVSLSVLKSFDQATAFLQNLNFLILALGVAAVLVGSVLVFFISTTFTRPLAHLVTGVHALEKGDFAYPLDIRGSDEVSELTAAFDRMRRTLQETQRKLLDAERLATIGRIASTISHDLRHSLTAVLAFAEFLSENKLDAVHRKDFYEEIRLAVNRMTDEISSLLGFSKEFGQLQLRDENLEDVIKKSIQTVRARPEYREISITFTSEGDCSGWFDPAKLERAVNNLLFNACEAIPPEAGKIEVQCRRIGNIVEICVEDNGGGVPEAIRENLFEPFVSFGKKQGTGLGLTIVQKIMQDHGGAVSLDKTGPGGSVFKFVLPVAPPGDKIAPA